MDSAEGSSKGSSFTKDEEFANAQVAESVPSTECSDVPFASFPFSVGFREIVSVLATWSSSGVDAPYKGGRVFIVVGAAFVVFAVVVVVVFVSMRESPKFLSAASGVGLDGVASDCETYLWAMDCMVW